MSEEELDRNSVDDFTIGACIYFSIDPMLFGHCAGPDTCLIHQKHLNLILFSLPAKMVAKIEKALHNGSVVDLRENMESAKQQVGL